MPPPAYALSPSLRRLAALFLVHAAVLAVSSFGGSPAGAQANSTSFCGAAPASSSGEPSAV